MCTQLLSVAIIPGRILTTYLYLCFCLYFLFTSTQFNSKVCLPNFSHLSWMSESGQGFSIEYTAVALHAVSRDPSAFRHECLYLQVEGDLEGNVPTYLCEQ